MRPVVVALVTGMLLALAPAVGFAQGMSATGAVSRSPMRPALQQLRIENRGRDAVIVVLSRPVGAKPFHHADRLPPGGRTTVALPNLRSVLAEVLREDVVRHAVMAGHDERRPPGDSGLRLGVTLAGSGQHQHDDRRKEDHVDENSKQDDRAHGQYGDEQGRSPDDSNASDRGESAQQAQDRQHEHGSDRSRNLATGLALGALFGGHKKQDRNRAPDTDHENNVLIDAADGSGSRIVDGVKLTSTVADAEGVEDDRGFAGSNTSITISNDPAPVANVPATRPPPCYCGPDMTAAFLQTMRRLYDRIEALPDSEHGSWDGRWFLERNGGPITLSVNLAPVFDTNGVALCPSGPCADVPGIGGPTMRLFGVCLPQSVVNDILYGYVAARLGVSLRLNTLDGDDPTPTRVAYNIGAALAKLEIDRFTQRNVGPLFRDATYLTIIPNATQPPVAHYALRYLQAAYPALANCPQCPTDASHPGHFVSDFSQSSWLLSDNNTIVLPPAPAHAPGPGESCPWPSGKISVSLVDAEADWAPTFGTTPTYTDLADIVGQLGDRVAPHYDPLGACGRCIERLDIWAHGDTGGGWISFGSEDAVIGNVTMGQNIDHKLAALGALMCVGGKVVINECKAGAGRKGAQGLQQLADKIGVPVSGPNDSIKACRVFGGLLTGYDEYSPGPNAHTPAQNQPGPVADDPPP